MRLIDADRALEIVRDQSVAHPNAYHLTNYATLILREAPTVDAVAVAPGRRILQANNERTNYRWNVTAECSECCDERKEIWAGFFPNVPYFLARDVAIESAKSVKLGNDCPNCGAKMDGRSDDNGD